MTFSVSHKASVSPAWILIGLLVTGAFPERALGQPVLAPPAASEAEVQTMLDRARSAAEAGNLEQAQLTYQIILTNYPDSLLRDRGYFGLAQVERDRKDLSGAAAHFQKILDEFPGSPLLPEARHELALAFLGLGRLDSALPLFETERRFSRDIQVRRTITDRIVEIYLKKKDRVQAVSELTKKEWTVESEREEIQARLFELMKEATTAELNEIARKFPKGYPGDEAILVLADQYESGRRLFEAEREYRRFLSSFPKHPQTSQVRTRIEGIKKRYEENRFLIGALLPLSGRLKPFGQEVLNGIRLGLERGGEGLPPESVGLVVRDTEETPGALAAGLEELGREYRVGALIGPLLSRQVSAASSRADYYRIPMLTPAASEDLSGGSKFVLRSSITNRQQARTIARYAMGVLNMKRFCILYSDDAYGKEMMRMFAEEVAAGNGEIIAAAAYEADATDFGPQIRRIKQTDLSKYGKMGDPPTERGQVQEYTPGFDAIFLPGDFDQVGLMAAQLAFYDLHTVVPLGTSGWNSNGLLSFGGKFIEGGIFVDGFFPGSSDPAVREFVEAYRKRYQMEPSLLSAQAYDSTRMILQALGSGASGGEAMKNYLLQLQYAGATGPIRFGSDGDMEKPLYIIKVQGGKFVQINREDGAGSPAPGG